MKRNTQEIQYKANARENYDKGKYDGESNLKQGTKVIQCKSEPFEVSICSG